MQRRLQQVRQQNPEAGYSSISSDFDPMLAQLISERAALAFADKYGFSFSKKLVDGYIAQLPQAKGLNGQFSEQAYQTFLQRERLTDAQVRQLIVGDMANATTAAMWSPLTDKRCVRPLRRIASASASSTPFWSPAASAIAMPAELGGSCDET